MPTTRLFYSALLFAITIAACTGGLTAPTPTPTPTPTLHTVLWVDFPSVKAGQQQGVNVTVNDLGGKPVAAANVILVIEAGHYKETYVFPITDPDGRSRITITVPAGSNLQSYNVTVSIVDKEGRWDKADTAFDAYP